MIEEVRKEDRENKEKEEEEVKEGERGERRRGEKFVFSFLEVVGRET